MLNWFCCKKDEIVASDDFVRDDNFEYDHIIDPLRNAILPIDFIANFSFFAEGLMDPMIQGTQYTFESKNFRAVTMSIDYVGFSFKKSTSSNKKVEKGWKLHVSLDCSDPGKENLKLGWHVIKTILMKYKVYSTKVIKKNVVVDNSSLGKEVTIYMYKDREDMNWKRIVCDLEKALTKSHVRPGPKAQADDYIFNDGQEHFVTFRYDGNTFGYLSQGQAVNTTTNSNPNAWNPLNLPLPPFIEELRNNSNELKYCSCAK